MDGNNLSASFQGVKCVWASEVKHMTLKISEFNGDEFCCPCKRINNESVVWEMKELEIKNDLSELPSIVNQCLLNVTEKYGDIDLLKIGLHEILVNSIEYGNLEITSKEKHQFRNNDQNYYRYTLEKSNSPEYSSRRVYIKVDRSFEKLVITVRDEGKGFNWVQEKKRINEPSRDEYSPCGRGIFIALRAYTHVNYNQLGNIVELVKLAHHS